MKKLFWLGLIGLLLFEIANVYFIMPMPGSQQMNSIDLAYFLYRWRWFFRIFFGLLIIAGLFKPSWKRRWLLVIPLLIVGSVIYMTNFVMAADHMFYQPSSVNMVKADQNKVDSNRLVIGVVENGEARAYPIRFLGYHHQVQDSVGGKPVIVTYCTVCRTGRVYEPVVNGKQEQFRLVGMDHFNAMFEDKTTGSWWRQVNGEAITGKLKGSRLPELYSTQTSLSKWLELYPSSLIMQADPAFMDSYDTTLNYESGKSRKSLTGTDTLSWKDKSWVIGVNVHGRKKAYDWNELMKNRIIIDTAFNPSVMVVLGQDNKSFFAFEGINASGVPTLKNDTLIYQQYRYRINGQGIDTVAQLKKLPAYQEFWHSWRTFNSN